MAAFKVLVLFSVVVAAVLAQDGGHGHHEYYTHHPKYHYQYAVHDDHTKDEKQVSEHRDGHHTESEYKMLEADHKNYRTVKMIIDSKPVHHGHH